jgi:hypothetical protein
VTEEPLQLAFETFLVGTDLERAFVMQVRVAGLGVQRVQLIDVVLGPTDEVGGLALRVDCEWLIAQCALCSAQVAAQESSAVPGAGLALEFLD